MPLKAEIINILRGNYWAICDSELRSGLESLQAMPDTGIDEADMQRRRAAMSARYATKLRVGASTIPLNIRSWYDDEDEYGDEEDDEDSQETKITPDGIAIVYLKGMVSKNGDWCTRGTAAINADMHALGAMANVKAVLLCIDSGGGAVDGTETLANTVYDYRRKYKKPVWVYVDGMAASAAYWIASGADRIYLSGETASVGSIGTMIEIVSYKDMYKDIGINQISIYATLSTNKNRAYEQALAGNTEPMRTEFLDKLNGVFLRGVIKGRYARTLRYEDLTAENIPEQLTGKVYFGSDAIAIGLADRIGTLESVLSTMYSIFVEGKQETATEAVAGGDKDDKKDYDTGDKDPKKDMIRRATSEATAGCPDKEDDDEEDTKQKALAQPTSSALRLTPLKSIISQPTKSDSNRT